MSSFTTTADQPPIAPDAPVRVTIAHPDALPAAARQAVEAALGPPPVRATPVAATWTVARIDRPLLRRLADTHGVDLLMTDARWQRDTPRLIAFDMDSTLITIECIDEIADFAGRKAQVAAITEATMRGEITDFDESLRRRVALLAGLPQSVLESVYAERLRLSPGVEALLDGARRAGWQRLLVSGGFTFFTERLRERLGFEFTRANELEIVDGMLTGQVRGPIVNADRKRETVESVCAQIGASPAQAIVVGDGANDLRMMAIAGLSVAYRAKPVVREQADAALNVCDLAAILHCFD